MVKVTGPLEKITMLFALLVFRTLRRLLPLKARKVAFPALMKLLLRVYKKANDIYSVVIKWEAKIMPLSLATTVLIDCRKGNSGSDV